MATKAQVKARKNKNDEWYTRYEDVENELINYRSQFDGKVIFCPCDETVLNDPSKNGVGLAPGTKSEEKLTSFIRFFIENKGDPKFSIKKLIATAYNKDGSPTSYWTWTPDMDKMEEHKFKNSNGDFRSEESIELLKESDIVVTNPPFSLFREFIELLVKYDKKFLVIGNNNAITYKEFFPLIRDNKVWKGYNSPKEFDKPDGSIEKLGMACWFTNLDTKKRHIPLYTKQNYYSIDKKESYPKYDNYDAINVDKVMHIPMDYKGVMGVPITYLDKYCADQFEILGIMNSGEENKGIRYEGTLHGRPVINGKEIYLRVLIRNKTLT